MAKVQSISEDSQLPLTEKEREKTWRSTAAELQAKTVTRLRHSPGLRFSHFIIFPDDPFIQVWSAFMASLMLYTVIITPYRVAFVDIDTVEWVVLDNIMDGLFFTDLVFNSLTAYYDDEKTIITSHSRILMRYAKSWMALDFIACLPVSYIFEGTINYNNLLRLSRLPRIYRLIRMFRLMRMMKVVKNRSSIMRFMTQFFRISLSMERLFWFAITLIFVLHLIACAWVFVGRFNIDTDPENWITHGEFLEEDGLGLYVVAMYWTITTAATIGYGDIHAYSNFEMCSNVIIMLLGVFIYSYMIGALTNLLGSLDIRKAKLNQKLELLIELSGEYNISKAFHSKLTSAIEYEHDNTNEDLDGLINTLPSNLRTNLLVIIYEKKIRNNVFFESRSHHFVAWVAPLLRPARYVEEEFIYREGDLAMEMFFIVSGQIDFVLIRRPKNVSYISVLQDYYFGELDLLFSDNKQRLHNAQAQNKCELLSFKDEHLEDLLKTFETEALEILAMSEERRARMDERKQTALVEYEIRHKVARHHSIPMKPEERQQRGAEFKKELEKRMSTLSDEDMSAPRTAVKPPESTPLASSSESSPESSKSFASKASPFKEDPPSPKVFLPSPSLRSTTRRTTMGKKPIAEKFVNRAYKKIITGSGDDIGRKVKSLTHAVEEMRTIVVQLCMKFNLQDALTMPQTRQSKGERGKRQRRASWQVPNTSIKESEESDE